MTRMEPGLNVPNHLCLRAGIHAALGHLAGAPVNDFVPLLLGVRVHGVIKAGNELAGQIRPVLLRQGHYFGHSSGGNAHAAKISASRPVLASAVMGGTSHQKCRAAAAEPAWLGEAPEGKKTCRAPHRRPPRSPLHVGGWPRQANPLLRADGGGRRGIRSGFAQMSGPGTRRIAPAGVKNMSLRTGPGIPLAFVPPP